MFDIGFPELLLVALVALLVLGPNRLPEAMRTMGLMFGRLRRSYMSARAEIEREIGMDEVRRELHNESIMREFKSIESDIKKLDSRGERGERRLFQLGRQSRLRHQEGHFAQGSRRDQTLEPAIS